MGSQLSLQVKIVLADQRQNLPDLIGLGLATNLLQRKDFLDSCMRENAMAAPAADFLEA